MGDNYLIRADASSDIGSGHVMRMIALGQMVQNKGGTVHFATIPYSSSILERLYAEGFIVHLLPFLKNWDVDQDVQALIGICQKSHPKWVVLDGYQYATQYQDVLKHNGFYLMCVDDIAGYHFVADIVLNQNLGATRIMYSAEPYTQFFLGPQNALLRREFIQAKSESRKSPTANIKNILITMGGIDSENISLKVLKSLDGMVDSEFHIKVITGPLNANYEGLVGYSQISKYRVDVLKNIGTEMASLMRWADVGISAAGSTIFEELYLNLPVICYQAASNQCINRHPVQVPEKPLYNEILNHLNRSMDFYILDKIKVTPFNIDYIFDEKHS
jgi:UDP-2,4-diacetamido-2,4,6-trideoxy-beta-L-altropyranose hydrolase